jgi:hypothetical protein
MRANTAFNTDSQKRRFALLVLRVNANVRHIEEGIKLNPTFEQAWQLLSRLGEAHIRSNRTEYRIEAGHVNNVAAIICYPRRGRVVIHADCWRNNSTCQNTRAGGIYNGPFSLIEWYFQNA